MEGMKGEGSNHMNKTRKTLLFLLIYIIIFWLGFKSGEVHNRIKDPAKLSEIMPPRPAIFYVVEKIDYGNYSRTQFSLIHPDNIIMHFLKNERLKPLLKLLDLQIYTEEGERIY
jgi:hypothetical protein